MRQKEILEKLALGLFYELVMEVWYTCDVFVSKHICIQLLISLTIITLKICRLREGVGVATCNAAEYRAVILGLRYALQKGFNGIRIKGDSKLVCMQVGHFMLCSVSSF